MEVEKMSFPKDWEVVKLGDVVDKVSIKALPKDYPDYPFIGMDCIEAHSLKPAFTYKFSEFKSAGNLFKKGQVLYGRMRPYLNKVYKADYEGTCSGEFIILQCKDNFAPDLLQYILHAKGFVSFATHQTAGDRPRISFDEIAEYPISLPPLAEQQRIVAKIEELFSELDAGKQELEKAAQQLKVYRQAVLKWAFEGRLTNDVVDGELPDGWKYEVLGTICEKIQDGSHFSPQVQYAEPGENRYMYITAKNIRNGYMDLSTIVYVDKDFHDSIYNRCNPEFGDVLLTKDGVNTGEVTLNTLHEPFNPSCALRSDAFKGVSDDKEGCFQIESFGGDCMNAPWHSCFDA